MIKFIETVKIVLTPINLVVQLWAWLLATGTELVLCAASAQKMSCSGQIWKWQMAMNEIFQILKWHRVKQDLMKTENFFEALPKLPPARNLGNFSRFIAHWWEEVVISKS